MAIRGRTNFENSNKKGKESPALLLPKEDVLLANDIGGSAEGYWLNTG